MPLLHPLYVSIATLALSPLLQAAPLITKTPVPINQEQRSKLDLNQATLKELSHSIKGIGQKRAAAIIDYREKHQSFHELKELAQVKGIGQAFTDKHWEELQTKFEVKEKTVK